MIYTSVLLRCSDALHAWYEEHLAPGRTVEQAMLAALQEAKTVVDKQRYHALVDTKYIHGLSPVETEEVRQLTTRLEAAEAPAYAPVIQVLRQALLDQPPAPKRPRRHPNRRQARHERQRLSGRKER